VIPEFSVGEMAILRPCRYPNIKTMTVEIIGVEFSEEWQDGHGYYVSPEPLPGDGRTWKPDNLHKIPPLSEQSFDEIMVGLKVGVEA
jgi:hypothetical protein